MRWPADFYCPLCGQSFMRWAGCSDPYHQTIEGLHRTAAPVTVPKADRR